MRTRTRTTAANTFTQRGVAALAPGSRVAPLSASLSLRAGESAMGVSSIVCRYRSERRRYQT